MQINCCFIRVCLGTYMFSKKSCGISCGCTGKCCENGERLVEMREWPKELWMEWFLWHTAKGGKGKIYVWCWILAFQSHTTTFSFYHWVNLHSIWHYAYQGITGLYLFNQPAMWDFVKRLSKIHGKCIERTASMTFLTSPQKNQSLVVLDLPLINPKINCPD